MARVPIDQFEGYTFLYGPTGYFQDGDFEVLPAYSPYALNILRPFAGGPSWSKGENWCTVLIKATVSSDTHPEPEELHLWAPLNFVRARMGGPLGFSENPFSHIYFFESGESYQYYSTGGNYHFVQPSLKVVGHRIPFRIYYKIVQGSLDDGEFTTGAEQEQLFSRSAGWEHEITSGTPSAGMFTYLTDVRLVPV